MLETMDFEANACLASLRLVDLNLCGMEMEQLRSCLASQRLVDLNFFALIVVLFTKV